MTTSLKRTTTKTHKAYHFGVSSPRLLEELLDEKAEECGGRLVSVTPSPWVPNFFVSVYEIEDERAAKVATLGEAALAYMENRGGPLSETYYDAFYRAYGAVHAHDLSDEESAEESAE